MNYLPSQPLQQSHHKAESKGLTGFSDALVLIYPIATVASGIDKQIQQVSEIADLDTYTIRQKLVGASVDVLCAGNDIQRLQDITVALREMGYRTAFVEKNNLAQSSNCKRAVAARIDSDGEARITFLDINENEIGRWNCEAPSLIVAGSLAPEQYGKSRALLASLYGGSPDTGASDSTRANLVDISKQSPALILTPEDATTPVLIDGLRFNYEFLGESRSLSLAQNFLTLIGILKGGAQSKRIQIDTDFGQKKLPVGTLSAQPKNKLDTQKMFALYASLMTLAHKQGFFTAHSSNDGLPSLSDGSLKVPKTTEPITLGLVPGVQGVLHPTTESPEATQPALDSIQYKNAYRSDSVLPPPPEGVRQRGNEIDFNNIISLARRIGPPPLIIGCLVLSVALLFFSFKQDGLFSFYWSFLPAGIIFCIASVTLAIRKRTISQLPTSKLRSMPMGVVEVKGRAKRKYALKAPHSLVNCIHYSFRILERTTHYLASRGKTESWRVVSRGDSGHVPFFIEDATGKALVNPASAILSGGETSEYTSSFADMLSGVVSNPNRRIIETVIPEDAELYIIGYAHPTAKAPNARRDEYRERLRALKSDPDLVARYDANNDGVISFEEWAVAKADLDDQLLQERLEADTEIENVVIENHPGGGVFYISDKGESDILRSYRWRIPVLGIIGFVLLVKGLWQLFGQ